MGLLDYHIKIKTKPRDQQTWYLGFCRPTPHATRNRTFLFYREKHGHSQTSQTINCCKKSLKSLGPLYASSSKNLRAFLTFPDDGDIGLKEITKSFIKTCVAAVLMGFIALGSFNFFSRSMRKNLALILAIGIGATAYAILIYFMRIPEVDRSIEVMRKKVRVRVGERREEQE